MDTSGDRFVRQRLISGWDQQALTKATVILIGVGALGNEVAKNLGLAGVGRLVLCDPDAIEASNLSRAVLFAPDDIGQPKVRAAAHALARLSPMMHTDPRQATLTAGVGLGELADADLVLGCLDSRRARVELLGRCAIVDAPLVDGGTGPWGGEVRVRVRADEPCYSCTLTPFERGESDVPRSCAEAADPIAQPASIAAAALTAAWMTTVALRLLLGQPVGFQMLRIDAELGRCAPVTLARDPACPHHQPMPPVEKVLPVTHRDPVSALLAALPPGSEPAAWASFPAVVICRYCGAAYRRLPGVASLRCTACGAMLRHRPSHWLAEADPAARLCEVGIAPQEILPVHSPDGGFQWLRLSG